MHARWRGWRASIRAAEPGEASQCTGAAAPGGDPCPRRIGERANCFGKCRSRIGEVLRRTATQVWHGTVPSGDHEWIERRIARSVRAAVARGGIVKRRHPGIRSADCKDGQGEVSGNGVAEAGEGSRRPDRYDLCADRRGSAALPEESRRGMFCGVAAWAEELWRE